MNFEFVEFYPKTNSEKRTPPSRIVGTVHVFFYQDEVCFDVRGILVIKHKDKFVFRLPKLVAYEGEKKVTYPVFQFTNEKDYRDLMGFLTKEVMPIIKERMSQS